MNEKIEGVDKKIRALMDECGREYGSIRTSFQENYELMEGELKDIFMSSYIEPFFGKMIFIITDGETLEPLYAQTGPTRFMDAAEFFQKIE